MSMDRDFTHDAEPVCEGPVVTLVMRARDGDERAWAALVERYAPLIWSLCRRYRLDAIDTADVGQTVWLLLVNHLGQAPRSGRTCGLACYHNPAGMRTRPEQSAGAARSTVRAGRR